MSALADPFDARSNGHRGRAVRWVGHELVELDSPHLRVVISATRGAEIVELRAKSHDLDLLWHGHPDVVRNRGGRETTALHNGNFLDEFAGGWQVVIPNAQYPVDYRGAQLGQHGEAALLPWRWQLVEDRPTRIAVEFSVELRRLPLRIVRRVTVEDEHLRVDETVENLGHNAVAVQWGQHIALGGPLIEPGARWSLPDGTPFTVPDGEAGARLDAGPGQWPTGNRSSGEIVDLATMPPSDGTHQTVILGPGRVGHAALDNDALGLRVDLDWDPDTYPYLWMWTVLNGLPDWPFWGRHRVATIEPFTSPLAPLDRCIEDGTALLIEASQRIASWTKISVTELRRTSR